MKKSFALLNVLILLFWFIFVENVSALQGADFAIYAGPGTWEPSITAFEHFLDWKGLSWEEVGKKDVNNGAFLGLYTSFYMPGGWAGDYNRHISNSGDQHIRNFISNGGSYYGVSAGAFYACDHTIWEGNNYNYPSNIFGGDCIGPINEIAPWPNYVMTTVNMNLNHPANIFEPAQRDGMYYGEGWFVPYNGQEMQVFANWIVPSNPLADGSPAMIGFNYGQGRVVLTGPHFEIEEDDSRDGTTFGEELSDGPDGSDWPLLWTTVDWMRSEPITQPPGTAPTECSDGVDNDGDGFVDFGNDFGCSSDTDDDEMNNGILQCNNGIDDDSDNFVDESDLGCLTWDDNDEINPTGPQTIFSDDFESGLNNWVLSTVENNWYAGTNNPYQGVYYAEARPRNTNEPASVMERVVSTVGYNNIEFSYYRRLVGLDAADEFKVKWFDGTSWHVLEQTGSSSQNNANYLYKTFNLSVSASNNPDLRIRYECTAGAVSEYCRVDNVEILGQ